MEIYLLDKELNTLSVIDQYESFIWTERYSEYGDFELFAPVTTSLLAGAKLGYFVKINDSRELMSIDTIEIDTSFEDGNRLKITGKSLTSILTKRIIWTQRIFTNTKIQSVVSTLLTDNIICQGNRGIPNLRFELNDDPRIEKCTIDAQFWGENLYDAIKAVCDAYNIGFKIELDDDKNFVFRMYTGEDRSYYQTKNPYVVYSPSYGNLTSSNYIYSDTTNATVSMIIGEDPCTFKVSHNVTTTPGVYIYMEYDVWNETQRRVQNDPWFAFYNTEIKTGVETVETLYVVIDNFKIAVNGEEGTYRFSKDTLPIASYRDAKYNDPDDPIRIDKEKWIKAVGDDIGDWYFEWEEVTNPATKRKIHQWTIDGEPTYKNGLSEYGISNFERHDESGKEIRPSFKVAVGKTWFINGNKIDARDLHTYGIFRNSVKDPIATERAFQVVYIAEDTSLDSEEEYQYYPRVTCEFGSGEGLDRTEIFTDCRDVSRKYEAGSYIDDGEETETNLRMMDKETYTKVLLEKGKEALSEFGYQQSFEADVDTNLGFLYGRDFKMGDIVQIMNEYGMGSRVMVSEFVRSQDTSGFKTYPTFITVP